MVFAKAMMPPGGATYWPTSELETLKLAPGEGDWKLPGGHGFGQETTRSQTRTMVNDPQPHLHVKDNNF